MIVCKELVVVQFHIRQPAGDVERERVVLAALPPEVALTITPVQVTGHEIDDVGEVTGTRAGDTRRIRRPRLRQNLEALLVRLVRETVQGQGERLSLVRDPAGARTRAAANDGSGTDHDGVPP